MKRQYIVITEQDPQTLAYRVNQYTERGWEPLGGPSAYVDAEQSYGEGRLMFFQALIVKVE